jgi:hypothetical protein
LPNATRTQNAYMQKTLSAKMIHINVNVFTRIFGMRKIKIAIDAMQKSHMSGIRRQRHAVCVFYIHCFNKLNIYFSNSYYDRYQFLDTIMAARRFQWRK